MKNKVSFFLFYASLSTARDVIAGHNQYARFLNTTFAPVASVSTNPQPSPTEVADQSLTEAPLPSSLLNPSVANVPTTQIPLPMQTSSVESLPWAVITSIIASELSQILPLTQSMVNPSSASNPSVSPPGLPIASTGSDGSQGVTFPTSTAIIDSFTSLPTSPSSPVTSFFPSAASAIPTDTPTSLSIVSQAASSSAINILSSLLASLSAALITATTIPASQTSASVTAETVSISTGSPSDISSIASGLSASLLTVPTASIPSSDSTIVSSSQTEPTRSTTTATSPSISRVRSISSSFTSTTLSTSRTRNPTSRSHSVTSSFDSSSSASEASSSLSSTTQSDSSTLTSSFQSASTLGSPSSSITNLTPTTLVPTRPTILSAAPATSTAATPPITKSNSPPVTSSQIAGIAIGSTAGAVLIVAAMLFLWRRRHQKGARQSGGSIYPELAYLYDPDIPQKIGADNAGAGGPPNRRPSGGAGTGGAYAAIPQNTARSPPDSPRQDPTPSPQRSPRLVGYGGPLADSNGTYNAADYAPFAPYLSPNIASTAERPSSPYNEHEALLNVPASTAKRSNHRRSDSQATLLDPVQLPALRYQPPSEQALPSQSSPPLMPPKSISPPPPKNAIWEEIDFESASALISAGEAPLPSTRSTPAPIGAGQSLVIGGVGSGGFGSPILSPGSTPIGAGQGLLFSGFGGSGEAGGYTIQRKKVSSGFGKIVTPNGSSENLQVPSAARASQPQPQLQPQVLGLGMSEMSKKRSSELLFADPKLIGRKF